MDEVKKGMRRRLTRYGDDAFALFLRKSFIKGLGYGDTALDKPVTGIINTASDFSSCHGNVDTEESNRDTYICLWCVLSLKLRR